jgi:hypothetical protein
MIQTATAPLTETVLAGIERFDSRESFAKLTGTPALPFNPARPRKYWRDNAPAGVRPKRVYMRTLMQFADGTPVVEGGQPVFEPLSLSHDEATTVNIPGEEDDIRAINDPNKFGYRVPPVSLPLRELEGDEYYFVSGGFAWVVMVGRRALVDAERMKDPLVRIESKLDRILEALQK